MINSMGYYIAMRCASRKKQDLMTDFLSDHAKTVRELMPWTGVRADGGPPLPMSGDQACNYGKSLDLGWYRNAGWDCEDMIWGENLLRWMATKVGRRERFDLEYARIYDTFLPYTIYEHSKIPIVDSSRYDTAPDPWPDCEYHLCSSTGWTASLRELPDDPNWDSESAITKIRIRKRQADLVMVEELNRLDHTWHSLCVAASMGE